MAPSWPQEAPTRGQDRPKMAPRGPNMGSGWAPKSLKTLGKMEILAVRGRLHPKIAFDCISSWYQTGFSKSLKTLGKTCIFGLSGGGVLTPR